MTEPNKKPKTIFIKKDGEILSDFTKESIVSGIKRGFLRRSDEISLDGRVWRQIDENPALAKLFEPNQKPGSQKSPEAPQALANSSRVRYKPTKADELIKLTELLKSEAISQQEYNYLKTELISKGNSNKLELDKSDTPIEAVNDFDATYESNSFGFSTYVLIVILGLCISGLYSHLSSNPEVKKTIATKALAQFTGSNPKENAKVLIEAEVEKIPIKKECADSSIKKRYVHTAVNVRGGPGVNFSVITKFSKNDEIKVGEIEKGWANVCSDGNESIGFISTRLLKLEYIKNSFPAYGEWCYESDSGISKLNKSIKISYLNDPRPLDGFTSSKLTIISGSGYMSTDKLYSPSKISDNSTAFNVDNSSTGDAFISDHDTGALSLYNRVGYVGTANRMSMYNCFN